MELFNLSPQSILSGIMAFLPHLAEAVLVFLVARALSNWAARAARSSLERRKHDPEIIVLLEMLTRWGVLALGIVLALEQLAPGRFSSLIAGLGIAGFTIGFALQDVAKNFIAGILLLIQQPFEIGDSIEVSDYGGSVLSISLRTTEMRTWDGRHVVIPNAEVFISPIVNFSRAERRRIDISAGVAYDSDLDKVARTAVEAAREIPGILADPAPSVAFSAFGDSAIQFTIYCWVDTAATGVVEAKNAVVRTIKEAFERENIEMPFPTQTIRIAG